MRCRGSSSSLQLFLLLHAPKQSKCSQTLDTIVEEPNESNGLDNKSEHRCELLKSCEVNEFFKKSENKNDSKESAIIQENQCLQQKEKCRKQWETSPDQIKEITRSLSQINESNFDKTDQELIRNKTCATNKSYDNQVNRSLFPPINTMCDYELGKEQTITCVCDESHKSNTDFQVMEKFNNKTEPQWVVTRPKRNKPKDNLILEGQMELETTFKTTYESTAKQISDNLAKNVAIVSPSSKLDTNKTSNENLAEKQRQSKTTNSNEIKSSKKKSKHRPSTSLKPGGDGYFNTINKESYKNFVIINDNSKKAKPYCSSNGKSVCCATVANIKLPKVETNNKDQKQSNRRLSSELKSTEIEQIDRSMNRLTTEENRIDSTNKTTHTLDRDINQSSAEILNDKNRVEYKYKDKKQEISRKSPINGIKSMESENMVLSAAKERVNNWTVGTLEEPKRIFTRDVDNIKELGILDGPNGQSIKPQQIKTKEVKQDFHKKIKDYSNVNNTNGSTRVRNESKNYVQSQSRLKKYKNESSVKLFQGDMDFSTTTKSYFDKSSNRNKETDQSTQRKHTAGLRTRKSGRNKNLFRTSTESEFCRIPNSEKFEESTYQNQFDYRLHCPALDLGSVKSDFKYRGESSGHKFFLPAVKY